MKFMIVKPDEHNRFDHSAGDAARSKSNSGLLEVIQFNLELGISWMFGGLYAFTGWLCGIRTSDGDAGQTPSNDQVPPHIRASGRLVALCIMKQVMKHALTERITCRDGA